MAAKLKKVLIFGDSHSRSFKNISINGYDISLSAISGASVLGLRKLKSHLGVSEKIREELKKSPKTDYLVIKLGQVDIENIYLYKKYIDGSFKDIDTFLDTIFASYSIFIDSLVGDISPVKIILWSVSPPTPVDKNTKNIIGTYFSSMTGRLLDKTKYTYIMSDKEFLEDLEYSKRIQRSRKFNERLKKLAKSKGTKYGEVFNELLDKNGKIIKHFEGYNYHIKGTDHKEKRLPADPKLKSIFESALKKLLT